MKTPCGVVGYHVRLQLQKIINRKVTGPIPVEGKIRSFFDAAYRCIYFYSPLNESCDQG